MCFSADKDGYNRDLSLYSVKPNPKQQTGTNSSGWISKRRKHKWPAVLFGLVRATQIPDQGFLCNLFNVGLIVGKLDDEFLEICCIPSWVQLLTVFCGFPKDWTMYKTNGASVPTADV